MRAVQARHANQAAGELSPSVASHCGASLLEFLVQTEKYSLVPGFRTTVDRQFQLCLSVTVYQPYGVDDTSKYSVDGPPSSQSESKVLTEAWKGSTRSFNSRGKYLFQVKKEAKRKTINRHDSESELMC